MTSGLRLFLALYARQTSRRGRTLLSVVGVALTPAQAPGLGLTTGDRVRVVVTPAQGEELPTGGPQFSEATVAGVHVSTETGELIVDLLVPQADAAVLAARAATRNVSLVLDSRDR